MRIIFFFAICLIMILLMDSCSYCSLWGTQSLGNNFIIMEGDEKDRLIVYCTGKSSGCCSAGIPVIPSRKDSVSKYLTAANSNKKWLVASTINADKSKSYWILDKNFELNLNNCEKVDCDSTIQSHVIGPLTLINYQNQVKKLNIDLKLKEK